MWKTKLAYMALGAVIASLGYFIGTFNNLNAEDEVTHVKKLIVSEEIVVGDEDGQVRIIPAYIQIMEKNTPFITIIKSGETKMIKYDDVPGRALMNPVLRISATANPAPYFDTDPNRARGIMHTLQPTIELRKPDGKQVTLQVADEASIKLSNGGLKSKTVAVD